MTGKIRIEGEPAAGMVLGGLISTFRGEGETLSLILSGRQIVRCLLDAGLTVLNPRNTIRLTE